MALQPPQTEQKTTMKRGGRVEIEWSIAVEDRGSSWLLHTEIDLSETLSPNGSHRKVEVKHTVNKNTLEADKIPALVDTLEKTIQALVYQDTAEYVVGVRDDIRALLLSKITLSCTALDAIHADCSYYRAGGW